MSEGHPPADEGRAGGGGEGRGEGGHDADDTFLQRILDRLPPRLSGVVAECQEQDVLLYAGGLAFYGLTSVAPSIVIAFWLAGVLIGEDRLGELGDNLDELAPTGFEVSGMVDDISGISTGIGLGALVVALWPATAYGSGLVRAFDRISHLPDRRMQGTRGRVKALLLVALLPAFIFGALGVSYVAAGTIGDGALFIVGWAAALVGGFLAAVLCLSLIYRVFGPDPLPLRPLFVGAAAAAIAIAVMSLGYVVYLGQGADFEERVAGSGLASVVLLALWLYLANVILLTGFSFARSCAGAGDGDGDGDG